MKECAAYGGVTERSEIEAIYEHPQWIDNKCFAMQSLFTYIYSHSFFVAHVDNNLDTPLNSCTIPTPACLSFQSILPQVIWFLVGNREPSFPNCVAMQDWKDDSHNSEDT